MKAIDFEGDFNQLLKDYNYQPCLTPHLDALGVAPFTQEIINEIVLWKVARYARIGEDILRDLEALKDLEPGTHRKGETQLQSLLDLKGVDLPMASTILRFRNPSVYQIIDRRAYRAVYEKKYPLYSGTPVEKKVSVYFDYLDKLVDLCSGSKAQFETVDRLLYQFDKKVNGKL